MHWTRYVAESQNVELHDMAWEFLLDDTKISTLNMILRCLGSGDASAHEYRYNNCVLFVGASALHLTSFSGSTAIVSRLLDSGIDPNVADSARLTPLMYASLQGHDEVVRLLLEAGADEGIACLHNSTALHRAVFHGCENVIEALLRQKTIDINLREGCSGFYPSVFSNLSGSSEHHDSTFGQERPFAERRRSSFELGCVCWRCEGSKSHVGSLSRAAGTTRCQWPDCPVECNTEA